MTNGPVAATQENASAPTQSTGADVDSGSAAPAAAIANSIFVRALENGGYFIDVGPGLTITEDEKGRSATVNLEDKRQILPGVLLRQLTIRRNSATVTGDITVPHIRSRRNGMRFAIDSEGRVSFETEVTSDLPVFKNKRLQLSLDEEKNLSATLEISPTDITPSRLRNLTVTGGGTIRLANGMLSGDINAQLAYDKLGSGEFNFNFNSEGQASGDGTFHFEQDFLNGATANLEIDEEANLKADVGIPVGDINTPIPGLSVTEGTVRFTMNNATPGGGLEGLKLVYNGFGEATLNATIRRGIFTGGGTFGVTISELTDATGRFNFSANGALTGDITIRRGHFPRALQVRDSSITGTLNEDGNIDFSGEATIVLGPAGTGQLRASREGGLITIGTTITLENIPGLQSGSFTLTFSSEGDVSGDAEIATDDSLVPGLSGTVLVTYQNNLWSGETEITYIREDPSVEGSVTVRVRQTEEGTLVFSGDGNLTAEIIPGVEGEAGVVIDEEGNVVLNFAFTQTEPYELFPENRREREFLNISRNIPLWAGIVVAVIRIRAGARAGVGPAQIRNSRVEGSWEITSDEPPDFSVSSEFYMPAFVEGYVAFGAGLGIDVLLGSLTGGIEAMATAGLYGAISVVPELSYENGDWMFEGTATLAAGARLKLSLNAWAEIEALWVTVWERTWELASHTMPIGPDLVLRANLAMNLSNPTVPEITFEASDTDNEGLIDGAMPEDGPPAAGAREALENRAEWSGRTRDRGRNADSVPSELAGQANENVDAPAAPSRPPPRSPAPDTQQPGQDGGGDQGTTTGDRAGAAGDRSATDRSGESSRNGPSTAATSPGQGNSSPTPGVPSQASASASAPSQPTVQESDTVGTDQERYPNGVSLASLNEPAAPMPRTSAQQREDLNAAKQVFDLVERQVQDSEQLADYFERIRRRFHLTFIGYETVGGRTQVRLSINPDVVEQPSELVKGRTIAGKQSSINYTPGTINGSSSTVGLRMVADPLGPDHPAGSGPSGQSDLMGKLVTDRGEQEQRKYIRGHLLNDRIGGEGRGRNLFPITAAANRSHEQQIESRVKRWVNTDRYWVYYRVNVSVGEVDLSNTDKRRNKVNSRLVCEAAVYDLQNNKHNRITATIVSTYRAPPSAATVEDISGPAQEDEVRLATRPEDEAAEIERSSREVREYRLNDTVFDVLTQALGKGLSWATIREQLDTIPGMGGSRLTTLQYAYVQSLANRNITDKLATPAEKGNVSRINALANDIRGKLTPLL